MKCLLLLAFTFYSVSFIANASAQQDAEDGTASQGRFAAHVTYSHNAIIFASHNAAAIVRLREVAPYTVEYDYRLLRIEDEVKESIGSGNLFDEPLSGKPASTWIDVPDFKYEWSYSAEDLGWIYYKPEDACMFFVDAEDFEEVNLKRFVQTGT